MIAQWCKYMWLVELIKFCNGICVETGYCQFEVPTTVNMKLTDRSGCAVRGVSDAKVTDDDPRLTEITITSTAGISSILQGGSTHWLVEVHRNPFHSLV